MHYCSVTIVYITDSMIVLELKVSSTVLYIKISQLLLWT